jgi:hypothetical protein
VACGSTSSIACLEDTTLETLGLSLPGFPLPASDGLFSGFFSSPQVISRVDCLNLPVDVLMICHKTKNQFPKAGVVKPALEEAASELDRDVVE